MALVGVFSVTHQIVFEGLLPHSFICGYSNAFYWLSETQVAEIEINIDFLQHFCLLCFYSSWPGLPEAQAAEFAQFAQRT